jgi:hypothetical protein
MIATMPISKNISQEQRVSDQIKMLQAISCAVDAKSAIYISGPITTGKNFIEWQLLQGRSLVFDEKVYQSTLRAKVIKKNEKAILELAKKTRQLDNSQVIEPASLFIPEWSQLEYIDFWMKIIDSFVKEVVLVEGWQYSIGCAKEYNFSKNLGLKIRRHDGEVLKPQQGLDLMEKAVDEVEQLGKTDVVLQFLATGLRHAALEK